jgi:hypothetical protein
MSEENLDAANIHLDISKLTYRDHRPIKKRRHNRKRGWRPPETINVNITVQSYDIVRSIALARGQRNSPFYEELDQLVQDHLEKQQWLDMAIADKQLLRQENERLQEINLDISKRVLDAANIVNRTEA